jgi:hypothetical protein
LRDLEVKGDFNLDRNDRPDGEDGVAGARVWLEVMLLVSRTLCGKPRSLDTGPTFRYWTGAQREFLQEWHKALPRRKGVSIRSDRSELRVWQASYMTRREDSDKVMGHGRGSGLGR